MIYATSPDASAIAMNLAYEIEKRRAAKGDYPKDWPIIATRIKTLARWCCERCGVESMPDFPDEHKLPDGTMLTVHHLDGNKWNCEQWNLAALCQRCHLRIQAKVDFYRDTLDGTHSRWMARHVAGYNVHAMMENLPALKLVTITERSYENEWPTPKSAD